MKKVAKWMCVVFLVAAFTALYVTCLVGNSQSQQQLIDSSSGTTIETIALPAQNIPAGMITNEDKIQKELAREDIERLQSYPVNKTVQQNDYDYSKYKELNYGANFDIFDKARARSLLQTLNTLQNGVSAVKVNDFLRLLYLGKYTTEVSRILEENIHNKSLVMESIANVINNPQKAKTYLLSSTQLIYQASPRYTAIRAKYIFRQREETKMAVKDATWYWQDVEFFVVAIRDREGNTVTRVWIDIEELNDPQPYTFN